MPGKVIGKSLNNGFAGSFARTPDSIIVTRPNMGDVNIPFGSVLVYDGTGGVKAVDGTFTADAFVGIAGRETKTALNFLDQDGGGVYQPKEAVSVVQRGSINVVCKAGTPAVGGAVYVRAVADTGKEIGDLEAAADGANNVVLTNAQWGGTKDANSVCELVLLTDAFNEMAERLDKWREVQNRIVRMDRLASLGEMVSGVAHEIRNPLASMRIHLDLLYNEINDEKNR